MQRALAIVLAAAIISAFVQVLAREQLHAANPKAHGASSGPTVTETRLEAGKSGAGRVWPRPGSSLPADATFHADAGLSTRPPTPDKIDLPATISAAGFIPGAAAFLCALVAACAVAVKAQLPGRCGVLQIHAARRDPIAWLEPLAS